MLKKTSFIVLLTAYHLAGFSASQHDTLTLTLKQVIDLAKGNSIAAKQATTVKETRYWEWRTFKSNYQPQLALEGVLPGYTKSYTQVQQPNGTILFQPVHYDNSSLTLNFSQSLAATGGTIFGTTQLQRFDDFDRNNVLYNGIPYGIGYTQPLLQFNGLRWDKRIEPLKYDESRRAFVEAQEEISVSATQFFFDLLLGQVNLNIAETNLSNTNRILSVATTKFELGKISRNEILQLQLELLNSQKAVGTAKRDVEIATLNLRSYIGIEGDNRIKLEMPPIAFHMTVSTEKVLAEAFENRSDAIGFIRRLLEAKRDVAKAKGENGLKATLRANLGFSNAGKQVFDIYQSPKSQQSVELQLSIPVLDWGRSKSRTMTALANEEFENYAVEQDKQSFEQQIVTQVTLFNMMKEQTRLTAQAAEIAAEKYKIAGERYVLGDLGITDLSIAFQENDRARRDFVFSVRDFWIAYYQMRNLSLYDFELNRKIAY